MELPFHLRALPPEALDVLRFFSRLEEPIAHATYIMDELGLSERAFGKVVRRLVTKGYLQMGGDQLYRLTDYGYSAVEELAAYDEEEPPEPLDDSQPVIAQRQIFRRLVLVVPRQLVAGTPAGIQVGFNRAAGEFPQSAEMVVRLSLLHGDPSRPQEGSFKLTGEPAYHTFQVTPGLYTQMRLRLEAYQLGDNPDDINVAGGMYVDLPVMSRPGSHDLAAYGTDILITA